MALPSNPGELLAAVARVTGAKASPRNHITIFRVTVTSSDGKRCSINVRVHQKKFYKPNLRQVADCFRVDVKHLEDVFAWTPDELIEHLESFPAEVLDSQETHRRFADFPELGRFGTDPVQTADAGFAPSSGE